MAGKLSTKGNNRTPCCKLTDFAALKAINYRTLHDRASKDINFPKPIFINGRGLGKVSVNIYRVNELEKWLKDWNETHRKSSINT